MLPNPLPETVIHLSRTLPIKPDPVDLQGQYVYLEPLNPFRHAEALFGISNGTAITTTNHTYPAYDANEYIWQYMNSGPFTTLEDFTAYLTQGVNAPDVLPFCVYDTTSHKPIGSTSLMTNLPQHLKIEIGGIWYSPIAQRSFANTEATYLMLDHVFGLGYRRVEWKCNALNERSRRAAERIGFTFEGIQEAHYIIKGHNRDTAWFRILDHEWHEIKLRLQDTLYNQP
jgi:RimJ/RimL family protein N-acetyltransferase